MVRSNRKAAGLLVAAAGIGIGGGTFVGAPAARAAVTIANFEDGTTDGFGTLTSSGVTKDAFSSPTAGAVVTPATGGDLTKVLNLTTTGSSSGSFFNGGVADGSDLGYDFVANGNLANFLANDVLTFTWQEAPNTATSGYAQLYNIILNGSGAGYVSVGGTGSSSTATTGTVNQYPPYTGQVNTVTINYDAYKANLSANPTYLQLGITTNNDSAATGSFYFDNFALSTVPEPATAGVMAAGVAGLLAGRRRPLAR